MFPIKLPANNSLSSGYRCDYQICPDCVVTIGNILKDIEDQVFVDNDLSHDRRMFILNKCNAIEGGFIELIKGRIHKLISDNDIHRFCLDNIKKLSREFTLVYYDTNINFPNIVHEYDDSETVAEYLIDDPNPFHNNSSDDLENMLLDEYEMGNDFNVSIHTAQDDDENHINNYDDYGCSLNCRCGVCRPNYDFDGCD
ncbi:unnamed protein product [Rotaria sp. Silwood2]|nr:unnamed protein product [Rotaria sp. Silwood2]CAF4040296.1 unnamed protein product [Rotaria sp. Silwood2]